MKLKAPLLAAGLAVMLGVSSAAAQNPKNSSASSSRSMKQADKTSQAFIKKAIEGDIAEVNIGKLAQEKGQSQGTKDFGAMLVRDHSEHEGKAEEVASEIGVKPPKGSSIGAKATYAKLKVLSGTSFDRAFAKAMIKDHEEDIRKFRKESEKNDPAGKLAQ